ncbi:MAG: hypothetical protein QG635_2502, partial [Bacteroidota bacterium]|nr:hypothetical protein [Bacteroidota bacterium]
YDMISGSFVEYLPTLIDISIFAGSFGLFFTFYLLFIKFFPVVSIAESESLRVKK